MLESGSGVQGLLVEGPDQLRFDRTYETAGFRTPPALYLIKRLRVSPPGNS